MLIKVIFYSRC